MFSDGYTSKHIRLRVHGQILGLFVAVALVVVPGCLFLASLFLLASFDVPLWSIMIPSNSMIPLHSECLADPESSQP